MGLFGKLSGKGKKKEQVERERQEELAEKARQDAAEREKQIQAEVANRELQKKKQRQSKQAENQELVATQVTTKRREIDQITKAVERFERECKKQIELGREAQKVGNKRQALRHAQSVKRTKARIATYENQLKLLEDQLHALEDTGANLNMVDQVQGTSEALDKLNQEIDPDKVDDVLQDARDAVQKTQAVQDVFQADANLYGSAVDDDDLLAELEDDTFGPIGADVTNEIPDVPHQRPIDPTMSKDAAALNEFSNSMNSVGIVGSSSKGGKSEVGSISAKMSKMTTKSQQEIEEEELKELEQDLMV